MSLHPHRVLFDWPEIPALPPVGRPVAVGVKTSPIRRIARQELRTVLRQILASWSNTSSAELTPLLETETGPVWSGLFAAASLDISLTYADGEGWIGLVRGGQIGMDVMRVQTIPEQESLSRIFFSPAVREAVRHARNPALAMAGAWTELEARAKCLKQPLREYSEANAASADDLVTQTFQLPDAGILTLAVRFAADKMIWPQFSQPKFLSAPTPTVASWAR